TRAPGYQLPAETALQTCRIAWCVCRTRKNKAERNRSVPPPRQTCPTAPRTTPRRSILRLTRSRRAESFPPAYSCPPATVAFAARKYGTSASGKYPALGSRSAFLPAAKRVPHSAPAVEPFAHPLAGHAAAAHARAVRQAESRPHTPRPRPPEKRSPL